ncbi:MAG: DUF2948 family protein [Litorimonas sp.]
MTLKLLAQDKDDLAIVSSALQDAILRLRDVRYDPVGRSVSLRLSRFRHEAGETARIEAGLRVDGVMALRSQGLNRDDKDGFIVLLDMIFEPDDAPSGTLDLILAGGSMLRMEVESLDVLLADVGEARATRSVPDHHSPDQHSNDAVE